MNTSRLTSNKLVARHFTHYEKLCYRLAVPKDDWLGKLQAKRKEKNQ